MAHPIYDEQKAIEFGKQRMAVSKDKTHDFEHARAVEEMGIRILNHLREKNLLSDPEIDESLVRVVAWWHDSYKASDPKISLKREVMEGKYAAQITQEALKDLVEPRRLKLVLEAIGIHNNWIAYGLFKSKYSSLAQILMEADGLDEFRSSRVKYQLSVLSIPMRVAFVVIGFGLMIAKFWYIRSDFARSLYVSQIKAAKYKIKTLFQ